MKDAQPDHGYRETLPRRQTVPICRLGRITLGAGSLQVKCGDIDLCLRDSLLRGLFEPPRRFLELLGKPRAACVQASESELRLGVTRFRRRAIPCRRLDHVRRRGLAELVKAGEPVHRENMAYPRCPTQQCLSGGGVPRLVVALQSKQCEVVLRARIALGGGLREPGYGLFLVPLDTLPGEIHQRERHLRPVAPLPCSLFVPARRGAQIDRHTVTVSVEDAEAQFGGSIALLRGAQIPAPRFPIILFATQPASVDQPGCGLGFGHSLLGGSPAPTQRLFTVLRNTHAVRKQQLTVLQGGRLIPLCATRRLIAARPPEMEKAQLMLGLRMTLLCGP